MNIFAIISDYSPLLIYSQLFITIHKYSPIHLHSLIHNHSTLFNTIPHWSPLVIQTRKTRKTVHIFTVIHHYSPWFSIGTYSPSLPLTTTNTTPTQPTNQHTPTIIQLQSHTKQNRSQSHLIPTTHNQPQLPPNTNTYHKSTPQTNQNQPDQNTHPSTKIQHPTIHHYSPNQGKLEKQLFRVLLHGEILSRRIVDKNHKS